MPIEIKELNIKINVEENPLPANSERTRQGERNKIIAACVEQVMEILSKNRER